MSGGPPVRQAGRTGRARNGTTPYGSIPYGTTSYGHPPSGTGPPAGEVPLPRLADDDLLADDDALAARVRTLPPVETRTTARYRELFGRHGVDLLKAAEGGDSEAACRLGILLICHQRPAEGKAWLGSAAVGGDIVAEVLTHAAPGQLLEMAAALAYELTLPGYGHDPATWQHTNGLTGAETYYRSASQTGHSGATYKLALMCLARGDDTTARHLLAQAADQGHPDARRRHDGLNQQQPPGAEEH